MATYEEAFDYMLKTAQDHISAKQHAEEAAKKYVLTSDHVKSWEIHADNAMHRLFGQAELCSELFGVSVMKTLLEIERQTNENV